MNARILTTATVLALAAISCSKKRAAIKEKPRPVHYITVQEPESTVERSFSGVLAPAEGASIAFEVGGRVIEVKAKSGRRYEEGEVLAKIDPAEYLTQLGSARAAKTEAEQNEARTRLLWEKKNVSDAAYESTVAARDTTRAKFDSAQKKVNDCTLRMPYAGAIASVAVEAQTVVSAGEKVMALEGDGGMEFEIGIPAADIGNVKPSMTATLKLGSLPGMEPFTATVIEVATQPSSNTTYPVTLAVESGGDPAVRSGMDGEATITLPKSGGATISIPIGCVLGAPPDEQFVWLISRGDAPGHTVARQPVTAGKLTSDGGIEILGDSLKAGSKVVSRGVHRLAKDDVVTLIEPE